MMWRAISEVEDQWCEVVANHVRGDNLRHHHGQAFEEDMGRKISPLHNQQK